MASTTALPERPIPERLLPSRPPRTTAPTPRRWRRTRNEAAKTWASITRAGAEARHRYRRPALVISSFGCLDAAAWTTFGLGAGLLALGVSLFTLEMLGGDE